jgi:imidazolonepropionase-like amidohydrolase
MSQLALSAMALAAQVIGTGATFVIRDVTVIDVTGAPAAQHQTVVIRGDRIAAIGDAQKIQVAADAVVTSGAGKYAIPGLWDMHVHLWDDKNVLPEYVQRGITGVRDMGSNFERTKRWRAAIESGSAVGPHVVTCGTPLNGQPSTEPKLPVLVVLTPDDARSNFDRLDFMGVDFIKVLSDLPREAYFALAERSRHGHKPFAGHLPKNVTAEEAVEARQSSIEHLFGFPVSDEGRSRAVLAQCAMFGTRIVPTLTLYRRMAAEDKDAADALPKVDAVVRRARDAGAAIMAGTDTGDPGTIPGVTLHDELDLLVRAGLTPMEALRSATYEPARFLGREKVQGTLKPGMLADVVLLDGNPLEDIRNTRRVAAVWVRGRSVTPGR